MVIVSLIMARRRTKAKRRSSPKTFKVLGALESYAYLSIMTTNFLGTSPLQFLTSGNDIRMPQFGPSGPSDAYLAAGGSTEYINPDSQISLSEIVQNPALSFRALNNNVMGNWQNAAIQTFFVGAGFKLGKTLLRKPLANVNRNIIKPLTGASGIRL